MKIDYSWHLRQIDKELSNCLYCSNGVENYYKTWMWTNNVFRQAFRKIVATENSRQRNDKFSSERIEHANLYQSK